MVLDERKKQILNIVISEYMQTGEPVGSKALIEKTGLSVSSATIRSEMNELEKLGLLCKPHTSAGRIPSKEGLKLFAKASINRYNLTEEELIMLVPAFRSCVGLIETLKDAAERLAEFSGCTVFTASPPYDDGGFTFEVSPAGHRNMAIMAISGNGSVKSVFTRLDRDVSSDDALKLTKILNAVFAGCPINQINGVRVMLFKNEMNRAFPEYNCVILPVMSLVDQIKSYELCISGGTNLFAYPEFSTVEAAREYMDLLNRREDILGELLSTGENDIDIKIGEETHLMKSTAAGIVSVNAKHKIPIVIGVLGPARMNYSKIIAGCKHVLIQLKENIE